MAVKGDFSKGRIPTIIVRQGLPIMLAELVHVLYNVVDRMYIGHMPDGGTLALTGIGLSFPLVSLISAFSNLCSTGGAALMTIARGEKNEDKARRILESCFTLLLVLGLVLTGVMFAFAPGILSLLGGEEETLPTALSYFRVYVLGTVSVMISLGMNPFINAQGFPRIGMITVLLGAGVNILLDPLFIFALDMGVSGAALATVLAQTVSALWVMRFLLGKKTPLPLKKLHIDRKELPAVLKLGAAGFTFKVTNSLTQAVVNVALRSWGGPMSTLYIGSMSLINSLRQIMSLPSSGITSGASHVISYNYGAREYGRAKQAIRFILFFGLTVNTMLWAVMMLCPQVPIRIFTGDEELVQLAAHCARIYFGAFPCMAMQSAGQNTYVAINRPRFALFFSLLRKAVLVVPLTLLLPVIGFGIDGVFYAQLFSQALGATACFVTMMITVYRKIETLKSCDMTKNNAGK